MLHKCVVSKINGCKQNDYDNCKNRYDTNKVSEVTVFGELEYLVYMISIKTKYIRITKS